MSIGGKNQFILKKVIVMNTFLIFIMHTNPILNLITFLVQYNVLHELVCLQIVDMRILRRRGSNNWLLQ